MRNGVGNEKGNTEEETSVPDTSIATEIQRYLRMVDKNLKGFSRNAKDSILIEIEGHIQEKVSEFKGKNGSIEKVLDDLGEPEAVAHEFSPTVRRSGYKIIFYQLYIIAISLFAMQVSIRELIENPPTGLDQFSTEFIFMTLMIAIINLIILVHIQLSEKVYQYYAPITLLFNGFLGLIFILYVTSSLNSFLSNHIDISHNIFSDQLWNYRHEDPESDNLWLVSSSLLGSLSIVISIRGNNILFKDTADGISQMKNITFQLLPLVLIVDLIVLTFYLHKITPTFDHYFQWITGIGYISFILLLFIGTSSILILCLRVKLSYRLVHIDKPLFAYMVIIVLLLTSLTGCLIFDQFQITEDSVDRGYFSDYQDYPLEGKSFFFNGSIYIFKRVYNEMEYRCELLKWDRNLTTSEPIISLSMGQRVKYRSLHEEVVQDGKYLHILADVPQEVIEDDGKNEYQYYLVSLEGSIIGNTTFSVNCSNSWEYDYLLPSDTTVRIFFVETESNGTSNVIDGINITAVTINNGTDVVMNSSYCHVDFRSMISSWEYRPSFYRFIPGIHAYGIIIPTSKYEYPSDQTVHYDRTRDRVFYIQISYNGTIIIPLTMISNTTQFQEVYRKYEDESGVVFNKGFHDQLHFRREIRNVTHSISEYGMWQIHADGSVQETVYSRSIQRIPVEYVSFPWIGGDFGYIDEDGCIHIATIVRNNSVDNGIFILNTFSFDSSGIMVHSKSYPLSSLAAFNFAEKHLIGRTYDDISYFFFFDDMLGDNATSIITMECWIQESFDYKHSNGAMYRYQVEITNGEMQFLEYGPEIEPDETKDRFYQSVISGILTGLALPAYLWWLLKKRISS
ncbi:MAG: hypothetical protein KAU14_01100 [Thermoplasmata archaeon]|nr:hypothetical protein [Thermoplasmata archaeon]